ncbi:Cytochrome P450 71D7 [Panicum miliaceum]|uniref:Cytochrome P450 71D7 n=1 Tax=Panicum miliaceum TaxID=4540 RepID=A0A3L6T3B0_PANMI|nr:Cytochrome P450 71D7 [Panicum miliaceum]
MEMLTTVLPLISLVVALLLLFVRVVVVTIKKNVVGSSTPSLPPGPSKLPLIGSIHHLAAAGELPHHALTRLAREHGPVMHLQTGRVGLVVASSREAARAVMKVQDANFAHRPELTGPKTLLYGCADVAFASGAHWGPLRKMCVVKLLSSSRVKSFAPVRREETRALVGRIAGQPPGTAVDLRPMFEALSSAVVSRAAFGETFEHRGAILKEGLKLTSGFNLSDHFPSLSFLDVVTRRRLRRVHRQVDEILEDIIGERKKLRQEKSKDTMENMLDVLLDAMERQDMEVPITQDNIKAVIMDMFAGGTETTSKTIEWALAELMKNPKEMAKVQEEVRTKMKVGETYLGDNNVGQLSYLKLVVKETLRLHMPAPLLVPRVCKEQCRLGGYTIPAGSRVVINAWAMGRDPSYWEDAEAFRPGRFLDRNVDFKGTSFEFLPFGAGRRICPGIEFGLATIELCLAQLLFSFDWKLPGAMAPEDLDMSETSVGALSIFRKEPLRLIPSIHARVDHKN